MPFDATFDARTVEPRQSGGKHQVGNKWQGIITNTLVKPTKDQKGGIFEVEFSSPGGTIKNNYNIWNESEAARNIAKQQLSALCHATGIFQIDFKNDGAALRGGKLLYDVGFQAGQEPSAENPAGGYVEVKHIYDVNGNDSWGAGQVQQQQQSSPQPQLQQQQTASSNNNGGGWNNQTGGSPSVQSGWNNQQQSQQQPDNSQQGGWNNQGNQQTNPPWKT